MSQFKGTLGKWRGGGRQVEADDGTLICHMSGWKNESITRANENLISAAPDLLEAAQHALTALRANPDSPMTASEALLDRAITRAIHG